MQFPIFIELRRSRYLSVILLLFHFLAAVCIAVVSLPWLMRLVLIALVAISFWRVIRAGPIVGLALSLHGGLHCLLAGEKRMPAVILPDTTVFSHLIVLHVRVGEDRRASYLSVLPDQMPPEEFRILRLWLRWRKENRQTDEEDE